ncbi:hypothetical protein MNBD_UNCLBAC01-1821, partial [hydrothermal vent metagenome]
MTGFAVILFLFRRSPLNLVFTLALSYGLGFGLLAQWMLVLGILQISYSVMTIGLPLVVCAVIIFLFGLKRTKINVEVLKERKDSLFLSNLPINQ